MKRAIRGAFRGGRKSEVGSQKSEVRSQKSEVRSQKSEVRSRKSEVGSRGMGRVPSLTLRLVSLADAWGYWAAAFQMLLKPGP